MEYHFSEIEKKWQQNWESQKVYKVTEDAGKKSFYVLDMFPYPSGAGLHVGHPLGYIASDIFSRYKRLKGFNVLHPMGFDSFGLPAEQYAIETGQHPATTTRINIETFKKQLGKIGFCYDWSREVQTSDPNYYQWTQWVFLQLFNSWYNTSANKAEPIETLIKKFTESGSSEFTASEWMNFPETKKQEILMNYRLGFSSYGEVNWCEALGTVLANDEVINGFSERGGHPVVKKKMRQWYLRITAYANRLLEGLNRVDFSDSMKEMQKNWIGRSEGAELDFQIEGQQEKIKVYTTRPDTIFGVDFLVLAPEHELVANITSIAETTTVEEYLQYVKSRSDRERMAEVKQVSGCFTGAYALHPFTGEKIPVYIAEYVLAGYGTGAIMAVPCGDQRDYAFARHFNLPITNIIGSAYDGTEANPTKDAILENSGFLNGLPMKEAMAVALDKIESLGLGTRKVNFRMRDAGFSRQRYWGEPFPIQWIDGIPVSLKGNDLPLLLPFVEKYGAGPEGEGPLANIPEWTANHYETSTMPGYAGSSWYFLRYMDPHNRSVFCSREASDYWGQVDVYIGGTEHAVGHLLYSRMWTKVLFDLGYIGFDEPYKKLVNQGMIQGSSRFVYRVQFPLALDVLKGKMDAGEVIFVTENDYINLQSIGVDNQKKQIEYLKSLYPDSETIKSATNVIYISKFHVDVNIVDGDVLDLKKFIESKPNYKNAEFVKVDGNYVCGIETEKMSKSKYNTINPDVLVEKYGADTFRMYEMFLGPVEASKPWDTKGIEGVHRFLRKLWRLFNDEVNGKVWTDEPSTAAELKVLHRSIRKIESDTEHFSFNTAVSAFMVCVNELTDLKCNKKEVLEKLLILLTPYAPHISEELWHQLGHTNSILDATYPEWDEKYLIETAKEYPVSINGKLRTTILMDLNLGQEDAEKLVLLNETVQKWLEGKAPKKIVFVKGKMVNVVI